MKKRTTILILLLASFFSVHLFADDALAQATDPTAIVNGLFDAINNAQAEKATSYFADDGQLITAWGQPKGVKKLLSFFTTTIFPLKTQLTLLELNVSGVNVTGVFAIKDNGGFSNWGLLKIITIIQDGKFKSVTWTTNPVGH